MIIKEEIRKEYLAKRRALAKKEFWEKNEGIMAQIQKQSWELYKNVHIFLPIKHNNEVDTYEIVSYFRDFYPDLKLFVPKTNFKTRQMEAIAYDYELTILQRNKYGIPEPVYGKVMPPEEIDVVFVPLLAFDAMGHRVGYGGGFYDRFLANCKFNCNRIGLSLFESCDFLFDAGPYDIKLTQCLTPTRTHQF